MSSARAQVRRFGSRLSPFYLLAAVAGLVMCVLIIYPLVHMLVSLFAADPSAEESVISQTLALEGLGTTLRNTAVVVGVSGVITLAIGSLFAWLNERSDARMGWLSGVLPVVPLLLPPIASAIGWVFMLSPRAGTLNVALRRVFGLDGDSGPFNIFTWYGMVFLYVVELVPLVYLVVSAALRNIDPALEQASRMSGAGPLATVWKVTLPAIRPALISAAWLCLTVSLVLFSAPSIVGREAGISVLSTQIVELLTGVYPPRTQVAVMLGTVMLACIAGAWLVQHRLVRAERSAAVGQSAVRPSRVELGIWKWPARVCMVGFIALATVLPVLGLLAVSLQSYWSAEFDFAGMTLDSYRYILLESTQTKSAIWNSTRLGLVGATLGILIAFLVAMLDARRTSVLSRVFNGVLKLPSAFSHIIVAIGILLVFSGPPFNWSGTLVILLLAYIVVYLPQASIAAGSAVTQVNSQLIDASHTSGAGDGRTMRMIAVPLMLPGLASGWALLFVYMAGDLTASVLLAGTRTPTTGYLLLGQFENGSYPRIAAFGLIVSVVSTFVVLTVLRLTHGKIGGVRKRRAVISRVS